MPLVLTILSNKLIVIKMLSEILIILVIKKSLMSLKNKNKYLNKINSFRDSIKAYIFIK